MRLSKRLTPKIMRSLLLAGILFILAACAGQADEAENTPTARPSATPIPTQRAARTPAPTPTSGPDLSGETFTIYVIASSGEPFTEVSRVVRHGLDDYAAYLNDHGGVYGAELELEYADVDASGAGALSAFELFSERSDALVILVLAPINQQMYTAINYQDIPVITFGAGALPLELTAEDDHLFWLVPTPEQQLAVWLEYALRNWDEIRPEGQFNVMRLNYISWNGTGGGIERLPSIESYMAQQNILLAADSRLTPSANASAANPILEGVFDQATMLYLDLFSYGPAIVLNDLAYLDLGSFFTTAGGSWALSVDLETYLPNPDLVPEIYTLLPIAWWTETDNPGIQTAEEIFAYSGRDDAEQELGYLYALAAVDLTISAMEEALSVHNDLEPRDVYDALTKMEDYAVLNGLLTVDFLDDARTPQELRIWLYNATEGLTPISEPLPLIELPD